MSLKSMLSSLLALGLAGAACTASAEYKVWYNDNVYGTFNYGDIAAGNTKLIPPSYACALRFVDPDPGNYRWVGTPPYVSGTFNKSVHVWFPKPGCPYNQIRVEYQDGSHVFAQPGNVDLGWLGISTSKAVHWVTSQGKIPSCGCIPNFPIKTNAAQWAALPLAFDDIKAMLRNPNQQTAAAIAIRTLRTEVDRLGAELDARIAERRRTRLPDRETSVRSLEDAASRHMAEASVHLDNALALLSAGNPGGTHTEVDIGRENTVEANQEADLIFDLVMPQRGE